MLFQNLKFLDSSNSRFKLFSIVFIVGVATDQISKLLARNYLDSGPKLLGNTDVGFSLTSNSGSAFSLFQGSTILITISSVVIIVILLVSTFRTESNLMSLACMLISTGAFGNLIDRFFQYPYKGSGHVTDFIKVGSFPTFNAADSLVTIGACFLILSTFSKAKADHESR